MFLASADDKASLSVVDRQVRYCGQPPALKERDLSSGESVELDIKQTEEEEYMQSGVDAPRMRFTITRASKYLLNPYPANVDNMTSSYQCQQMADGI